MGERAEANSSMAMMSINAIFSPQPRLRSIAFLTPPQISLIFSITISYDRKGDLKTTPFHMTG